jgi:hypothetical protein
MSGILNWTSFISLASKELGDYETKMTGQNGHGSTRPSYKLGLAHHCPEQAKRTEGQISRGNGLSKARIFLI